MEGQLVLATKAVPIGHLSTGRRKAEEEFSNKMTTYLRLREDVTSWKPNSWGWYSK